MPTPPFFVVDFDIFLVIKKMTKSITKKGELGYKAHNLLNGKCMRLLIQRVQEAKVFIQKQLYSEIGPGLLVLLGIHKEDDAGQIKWLVNKLVYLRIFSDEEGKMNRSVKEMGGQILIVSQFTLYGNCLNGRRPDFVQAAPPAIAQPLYQQFVEQLSQEIDNVQTGVFGAEMQISLINDGPVTFLLEKDLF